MNFICYIELHTQTLVIRKKLRRRRICAQVNLFQETADVVAIGFTLSSFPRDTVRCLGDNDDDVRDASRIARSIFVGLT